VRTSPVERGETLPERPAPSQRPTARTVFRLIGNITDTGKDSSQKLTDVSYRSAAGPCNPFRATATTRERSSSPPSTDQPSQVRILGDADERGRGLRTKSVKFQIALHGVSADLLHGFERFTDRDIKNWLMCSQYALTGHHSVRWAWVCSVLACAWL
jgi:hypothetical protein